MSAINKIIIDDFIIDDEKKELIKFNIEFPFGTYDFSINILDTTIATRGIELGHLISNLDNLLIPTSEITECKNNLDNINKIKNAVDYVYNIDVCKNIYKKIDPFKIIKVKGQSTIFCLFLLENVSKSFKPYQAKINLQNKKAEMTNFVNAHA